MQAVDQLVKGYVDRLSVALPAALDSRKLASEAGAAPTGLLGGPGGARSAAATGKVQVTHCSSLILTATFCRKILTNNQRVRNDCTL